MFASGKLVGSQTQPVNDFISSLPERQRLPQQKTKPAPTLFDPTGCWDYFGTQILAPSLTDQKEKTVGSSRSRLILFYFPALIWSCRWDLFLLLIGKLVRLHLSWPSADRLWLLSSLFEIFKIKNTLFIQRRHTWRGELFSASVPCTMKE